MSIELVMPSNHLILYHPLLLHLKFSSIGSFPVSQLFTSGGQRIGVSASASVLPMNIRVDFLKDWQIWSPCCSRVSQESSPVPRFKSINSSVVSLLYGPTVHDFLGGWVVKNLPAMHETQVRSLVWEDPLEKKMATTPVFLPEKSHGERNLAV